MNLTCRARVLTFDACGSIIDRLVGVGFGVLLSIMKFYFLGSFDTCRKGSAPSFLLNECIRYIIGSSSSLYDASLVTCGLHRRVGQWACISPCDALPQDTIFP